MERRDSASLRVTQVHVAACGLLPCFPAPADDEPSASFPFHFSGIYIFTGSCKFAAVGFSRLAIQSRDLSSAGTILSGGLSSPGTILSVGLSSPGTILSGGLSSPGTILSGGLSSPGIILSGDSSSLGSSLLVTRHL